MIALLGEIIVYLQVKVSRKVREVREVRQVREATEHSGNQVHTSRLVTCPELISAAHLNPTASWGTHLVAMNRTASCCTHLVVEVSIPTEPTGGVCLVDEPVPVIVNA